MLLTTSSSSSLRPSLRPSSHQALPPWSSIFNVAETAAYDDEEESESNVKDDGKGGSENDSTAELEHRMVTGLPPTPPSSVPLEFGFDGRQRAACSPVFGPHL